MGTALQRFFLLWRSPMNTFAFLTYLVAFLGGAAAGAWLNGLTTEARSPVSARRRL